MQKLILVCALVGLSLQAIATSQTLCGNSWSQIDKPQDDSFMEAYQFELGSSVICQHVALYSFRLYWTL